jgi:lipoprotein-anchoring transpeptidase ErfK/SrfK
MLHVIHTRLHPTRILSIVSVTVLLIFVLAPAAAAGIPQSGDLLLPRPVDPRLGYVNGLEPGTMLGGVSLPVDWSRRVSPCPSDPEAAHFQTRVAPTMRPPLCPGDVSEAVVNLQILLREKKLYREPISGVFDEKTQYAVFAFHKIVGPAHSDPGTAVGEWLADPPPGDWTPEDWEMLEAFAPQPPKARIDQPDRVEVDIGHQVVYLIEGDEVVAIMPISTGKGSGERGCTGTTGCTRNVTPRTENLSRGSVFYTEHAYGRGWSPLPGAWSIYKAIFYSGQYREANYGLHGYRQVPNYPASHGCIRLTVWDMDFLRPSVARSAPDSRVWTGMTIHVWDA